MVFLSSLAPVLQRVPLSPSLVRIVEQMRFRARCPVLPSDLFPEFPCDSELIPVEALSTEIVRLLWRSGCGTEFTYKPDCEWLTVVYPSCVNLLRIPNRYLRIS